MIITTGGVGAENKDFSVEAIERLDADAATPYIAKFVMGHGRHSKEGIRIGVGQMGITKYIALPGPNDEVALCIDTVVRGVKEKLFTLPDETKVYPGHMNTTSIGAEKKYNPVFS